jgi:hypothetical protein
MNISILNKPSGQTAVGPADVPLSDPAGTVTGISVQVKERIWQRMARECHAMLQHALSTGRIVPAEVIECFDHAIWAPEGPVAVAMVDRRGDASADVAAPGAPTLGVSRFASLAAAHAGLARAIAPATPEAVLLMAEERERHPFWCEFGPLPLVRQMLCLALVSLVTLLGMGISKEVNTANLSQSMLELSGYRLLMIETFLVSAASLGSCFANLQRINTVIADGTYDPRVQSIYWTRWVMGVISGIVLSQIVYDYLLHSPGAVGYSGSGTSVPSASAVPDAVAQPLLALVGGYSVDFVHGLLRRAIDTLGHFFALSADGPRDQRWGRRAGDLEQERLTTASAGRTAARPEGQSRRRGLAETSRRADPIDPPDAG